MSAVTAREQIDHQYHIARRNRVIREIGFEYRESFEKWAFRQSPFRYDKDIQMAWHKVHSTKGEIPEEQDEALSAILDIWKSSYVPIEELVK